VAPDLKLLHPPPRLLQPPSALSQRAALCQAWQCSATQPAWGECLKTDTAGTSEGTAVHLQAALHPRGCTAGQQASSPCLAVTTSTPCNSPLLSFSLPRSGGRSLPFRSTAPPPTQELGRGRAVPPRHRGALGVSCATGGAGRRRSMLRCRLSAALQTRPWLGDHGQPQPSQVR